MALIKSTTKNVDLLKRKVEKGTLRFVGTEIYTDDLVTPLTELVEKNAAEIAALLSFPGRLAYASALTGLPYKNTLFLVGNRERSWSAHGIDIVQFRGSEEELNPIEIESGVSLPTSNFARAIVENFSPSAVHRKKSNLSRAKVELEAFYLRATENERLVLESKLKYISEKVAPKAIIEIEKFASPLKEKTPSKVDFKVVAILEELSNDLTNQPAHYSAPLSLTESALFLECYFSNYIEGTKLSIDEAKELMRTRSVREKHAEGHDVVSLREVMDKDLREQPIWRTAAEWKGWMKSCHAEFLSHRPDKNPGQFKRMKNYAGSTQFTLPVLVDETLDRVFEMSKKLPEGWARGCFLKAGFLMVHPFEDGNGRIGRLILNHCLTEVRERRLIVPTVFREDYLLGMSALSRGETKVYARMMNKVKELTNTATVDVGLDDCIKIWENLSAFVESRDGKWGRLPEPENASGFGQSFGAAFRTV